MAKVKDGRIQINVGPSLQAIFPSEIESHWREIYSEVV